MTCCPTASTPAKATDSYFTKQARRYLKQFRRKGLAKEQRYLLEGITSTGVTGKSILEIGSGAGGLHLTLLNRGASSAVGVDVAEGMVNVAKELSREMHLADRATYHIGDFVRIAERVPETDVVILDKVVCCYENLDELLSKSMLKARTTYALSFPRSRFIVRTMFKTMIAVRTLLHTEFRPYWHDWNAMLERIRADGFLEAGHRETFVWATHVFVRKTDGTSGIARL